TSAILCNQTANSCSTDEDDTSVNNPFRPVAMGGLGGQNDMIENYMDYGYQSCQDRFTEGQKDRMRAALTGIRSSLLSSLALTSVDGHENPAAASCTPSTSDLNNNFQMGVKNVTLENLDVSSGTAVADEGYKDFTCGQPSVSVQAGSDYSISITT